jgi:hypothetical protein
MKINFAAFPFVVVGLGKPLERASLATSPNSISGGNSAN